VTVKEISGILQVSVKTVYQWTHIGYIPHYKLPKGVRFGEDEIWAWIKKRKVRGRPSFRLTDLI